MFYSHFCNSYCIVLRIFMKSSVYLLPSAQLPHLQTGEQHANCLYMVWLHNDDRAFFFTQTERSSKHKWNSGNEQWILSRVTNTKGSLRFDGMLLTLHTTASLDGKCKVGEEKAKYEDECGRGTCGRDESHLQRLCVHESLLNRRQGNSSDLTPCQIDPSQSRSRENC